MNETQSNRSVNANKTESKTYNPNPFFIAVGGIERLFQYAKPMALVLLITSIVIGLINLIPTPSIGNQEGQYSAISTPAALFDSSAGGAVAIGGAILLAGLMLVLLSVGIILFFIFIAGLLDFTAASAAKGKTVTFRQTFEGVASNFWPYIKLRVLVFVKTFLWSLLLIVPGVYFSYRYYLSGVVFFAEGKRGSKAIQESMKLTKGAWLTTFASYGLFNLVTLGFVQLLAEAGTSSELYRNYRSVADDDKASHPSPHWLSWLFGVGLIVLAVLLILVAIAIVAVYESQTGPSGTPVMDI